MKASYKLRLREDVWPSIGVLFFLGVLVLVFGLIELTVLEPVSKTREGLQSNWDIAENSYKDDDCVDAWDKLAGGIKSMLSFDKFKDIDRKKLLEQEDAPEYKVCIKKAANYTLECPSETVYVTGCNGKLYKNACFAERDGIYTYTSENGVTTTD
jgi:hypothetical protein